MFMVLLVFWSLFSNHPAMTLVIVKLFVIMGDIMIGNKKSPWCIQVYKPSTKHNKSKSRWLYTVKDQKTHELGNVRFSVACYQDPPIRVQSFMSIHSKHPPAWGFYSGAVPISTQRLLRMSAYFSHIFIFRVSGKAVRVKRLYICEMLYSVQWWKSKNVKHKTFC